MRRIFLSFLVLAFVAVNSPAATPKLSLPVTGYDSLGQICPVGEHEALTARHVAFYEYGREPDSRAAIPLRWSAPGSYVGGTVKAVSFLWNLDIAKVTSEKPFPFFHNVSPVDPKVGDAITLVGYDWDHGAKPVVMKGKIVGFSAGIMFISRTPGPGSSGSCVFNADGDVIGINFGGMGLNDGSTMGIAVVLSPETLELLNTSEEKDSEPTQD